MVDGWPLFRNCQENVIFVSNVNWLKNAMMAAVSQTVQERMMRTAHSGTANIPHAQKEIEDMKTFLNLTLSNRKMKQNPSYQNGFENRGPLLNAIFSYLVASGGRLWVDVGTFLGSFWG